MREEIREVKFKAAYNLCLTLLFFCLLFTLITKPWIVVAVVYCDVDLFIVLTTSSRRTLQNIASNLCDTVLQMEAAEETDAYNSDDYELDANDYEPDCNFGEENDYEDAISCESYDIVDYESQHGNADSFDLYDTSEYDAECERQHEQPPRQPAASNSKDLHRFGSVIDPVTRLMLFDLAECPAPDHAFFAANGSLLDDDLRSMVSDVVWVHCCIKFRWTSSFYMLYDVF